MNGKLQVDEKRISKGEDKILRDWLKSEHRITVPQFSLWNLTIAQAVEYLKGEYPDELRKLTAGDLSIAARRN